MRQKLAISLLLLSIVFPILVKSQADFTASEVSGCTPFAVRFAVDLSTVDIDTITTIDWHFGFGDTISSINPDTVIFENEGTYTVVMIINNDQANAVVKTDYINVYRTVSAVFRYEEYASNNNYRFIPLDDISDTAATYFYMWRYTELTGSDNRANDYIVTTENPERAVDSITLDTGIYQVLLRVEDTYGCISSFESMVQVYDQLQLANVFSPNTQQFYIIDPRNNNIVLSFDVFNRYGMLVFSQEAPIINWNGKTNSGQELTTGVYYYILRSVDGDETGRYNQTGFIHLFR